MGRRRSGNTIYAGNLPADIREREVEDLFYKYGPIVDIELKIPPRPPGYAFVEFEDYRDAEDAVYGRDEYDFDGFKLRVEFAHGGRRSSSHDRHRDYCSSRSSRGVSRRSEFRGSYEESRGERGGITGVVDYTNYKDMRYAVKELDDSQFRNAFSRSYIKVREYKSNRSPSPYRSRSCSSSPRGRSHSRSCSHARSISKSPEYSRMSRSRPVSSRSRSISRSKSPVSYDRMRDGSRSKSMSRSPSLSK